VVIDTVVASEVDAESVALAVVGPADVSAVSVADTESDADPPLASLSEPHAAAQKIVATVAARVPCMRVRASQLSIAQVGPLDPVRDDRGFYRVRPTPIALKSSTSRPQ
jgi:hypothetical protein